VALQGVAWRGVAWRGVAWRGVAWRGVASDVRRGVENAYLHVHPVGQHLFGNDTLTCHRMAEQDR
jgi:hypothetical protein